MSSPDPSHAATLSRTRQRRRERLLAVGAALLLRDGYHAATMEGIAAAAGVSKATLYAYFPDKAALFLAAIEGGQIGPSPATVRETRETLEQILRALAEPQGREAVTAALRRLLDLAAAGRADPFPRLMDGLAFDQPELLAQARLLLMQRHDEQFQRPLGALPLRLPQGLDFELLVHIFYTLIAGYQLLDAAVATSPSLTRDRWAEGLAALLLHGVAGEQQRRDDEG